MNDTVSMFLAALAASVLPTPSLLAQGPERVPAPIQDTGDYKPAPTPDPVKGWPVLTPLAAEELAPVRRKPHAEGPVVDRVMAIGPADVVERVLFDAPGDGRTWAVGNTFKASFGAEGFTYIPFLGSDAPRNHPVQFALAAVRAGGRDVAFDATALPVRNGDRIVFDRGAVQEIYDLTAQGVEQTFVVDGSLPGDVSIDLKVTTDLVENAGLPGLQFGNERGHVEYGTAFLVDGGSKTEIATTMTGDTLRLLVPAAVRGTGAVIVDPVIRTEYVSFSAYAHVFADVAYDNTYDRYLVVYERKFSATDSDLYGEMRDGNGAYVSNTQIVIDTTNDVWRLPRVANLNAYDRFLVVAEKWVPANPVGQQFKIFGRTVNAYGTHLVGNAFQISGNEVGDKREPDVGGDPMPLGPTFWTVVYTREFSSTDTDIHARQVMQDSTLRPNTISIENSGNTIYRQPQISQSNGDPGLTGSKRWFVVYRYRFSPTDWDIYGAALTWDGTVDLSSRGLVTPSTNQITASVSSPAAIGPVSPAIAVSWITDGQQLDAYGLVLNGITGAPVVAPTNLSNLLNLHGLFYTRIETDGCRFALAVVSAMPAYAATLAVRNNQFVVHEMPRVMGSNYDAFDPSLAARASGGGPTAGYAAVFTDANATPSKIVFAAYDGHGVGGATVRSTGCGGLGILSDGRPVLGQSVTIDLYGQGSDLVGMLIGLPVPGLAICPGCQVGVDLGGPLVNLTNLAHLSLAIPRDAAFFGGAISVQGYALGSGNCLGLLRLGDTLDLIMQ